MGILPGYPSQRRFTSRKPSKKGDHYFVMLDFVLELRRWVITSDPFFDMFHSLCLCRVSRPIAASHKRQANAGHRLAARHTNIAPSIAIDSGRNDSTSLTSLAYANIGSTGRCK